VEDYKKACLGIFSVTKRGEAIQKNAFSKLREITITKDVVKFQEMFDQAMHHAMINQSNVLMNSIQNVVRETIASGLQMGYKGSCYSARVIGCSSIESGERRYGRLWHPTATAQHSDADHQKLPNATVHVPEADVSADGISSPDGIGIYAFFADDGSIGAWWIFQRSYWFHPRPISRDAS
jgi:hypothetical protein